MASDIADILENDRHAVQADEIVELVELFHECSKLSPASYLPPAQPPSYSIMRRGAEGYKQYRFAPRISLPCPPLPDDMSLEAALRSRQSVREFSERPLTRELLGQLLGHSLGITRRTTFSPPSNPPFTQALRAAPSGGALYPIETYLALLRVRADDAEIQPGLYHYNVRDHALDQLRTMNEAELRPQVFELLCRNPMAQECAAVIFFSGVFRRTLSKYRARGYRFALLEAGHMGQNLALVGTALGLGLCMNGGYFDDAVAELLDLDGVNEAVVYSMALGFPSEPGSR